jgi:hypothetical protein
MKFLNRETLTREIQRICKTKTPINLAVAYWGKDALRAAKLWAKPRIQRSFIEALQDNGAQEFKQQKISFAIWTDYTSRAENRGAKRHLKESANGLEETLKIDRRSFAKLDWFSGWPELPADTFIVSCRIKGDTFTKVEICRTFNTKKTWPIVADGEKTSITYVLGQGDAGFGYRLSARDTRILKLSAKDLWRKAKGSKEGRLLRLQAAVPILLRHAKSAG